MKKDLSERPYVKIGEAAKALGVSIDTLRRWEASGKIKPLRTPGGTRLYPNFVKIGEAAKLLGVSIDTLRRWEAKGKLQSIRTPGGTRVYSLDLLRATNPTLEASTSVPEEQKSIKREPVPENLISTERLVSKKDDLFSPVNVDEIIEKSRQKLKDSSEIENLGNDQIEPKKIYAKIYAGAILSLPVLLLIVGVGLYFLREDQQLLPTSVRKILGDQTDIVSPKIQSDVLSASTLAKEGKYLEINADIISNGNLAVNGEGIFSENITAPNVVYGLVAGENITISQGQTPTIAASLSRLLKTFPSSASSGQFLVADSSGAPKFVTMYGDTFLSSTGAVTISSDAVALGSDTTGDYVKTISGGAGLTGSGSGEGSTPTLAVGAGNGITVNADDITIDATTTGTTTTTSANSGLETDSSGLKLLGGCSNSQILSWSSSNAVWQCTTSSVSGSGTTGTLTKFTAASTIGDSLISESGTTINLSTAATLTASSLATITTSSSLALNGPATITTNQSSLTLFNATATTVNAFGAATTLNLGASTGTATIANATVNLSNGLLQTAGTQRLSNAGALSNITGFTQSSGAYSATLTTTNSATFSSSTSGSDSLAIQPQSTTTTAAFTGTLTSADLTAARTYTLPNATGTVCVSGDTCASSGTVGYWSRSGTTLSPATANDVVSVSSNDNTNATLAIANNTANTIGAGGSTLGVANINSSSITTGNLVNIASTANGYTTGKLLNVDLTQSAATGTSVSGNLNTLSFSPTYSTAVTTPAISGNVLNISRSATTNSLFASTLTVSGALASFSDSATQTTGTLTSTADVLRIAQNYTSNSGAALNVTSAGGASGYALRVNDDGTFTDSTPFIVTNAGNVGVGTTTAATNLEVAGALRLSTTTTDTFTTPQSNSVATKINIPLFNPGASGQIVITGLPSSAPDTARAFTFVDARTVAHQPTLGVFSVDENDIVGFSWEGTSSTAYIKTLSNVLGLRVGTTDYMSITSATGVTVASGIGLTLTSGTGRYVQTFTGTTTNAATITANSLTTGTTLSVTGTSTPTTNTATTQNLFDITYAQATLANTNGFVGLGVNFTNNPTVAGNTEYAARIQNQVTSNTTDNAVAALLLLDNADTSATGSTVVTDALRITNSGAIAAGVTNGITFGSTTIDTGLNFSSTPTTNYISGTNFSVTAAGLGTFASNVAVNGGSVTTTSTTGNLFNTTATTLNIGGAATTALNIGNGNTAYTAINLGSGTGGNTINIAGTGATGVDTINIGTGGTGADTITIGNTASSTAVTISSGTGAINIGTSIAKTITLGNGTGATALALTSGTGSQTFTSSVATTGTTSSAFVFTDSALTSGTGIYLTATGLTSGTGVSLIPGTAMTTGSALSISSASYTHTAAETGNLASLTFSDTSSNATGNSITNGLNIASTINTTGAGTKSINAINIASPTKTACTTGACTWTGLAIANPGTLANTTFYAATFAGGRVGIGLTAPSTALHVKGTITIEPSGFTDTATIANSGIGTGSQLTFVTDGVLGQTAIFKDGLSNIFIVGDSTSQSEFRQAGLLVSGTALTIDSGTNLTMSSGAGRFTQTFTGTTTNAMAVTANSLTTGYAKAFTMGTALTTGGAINITGASYNHGSATETGSLINLAITDATNGTATSTTNGINISSTMNVTTGVSGVKTINPVNIAAPTLTACTGGSTCIWNGALISTQATGAASTITQNGLNIAAAGVAAGTLNGINIGGITAGAGTETAISIGTGWDTVLSLGTTAGATANTLDQALVSVGNIASTAQQNRSTLTLQNAGTGYFDLELVRGFVNDQGTNAFRDDFTGISLDTTKWTNAAATGAATCSSTFTVGVVNGVLRQTTGTTNPGACQLSSQATVSNGFYQRGNNPVFETSVNMGTGGAGVRAFFGFVNTAVASGSDTLAASSHAAMIEKRAADTDWFCVTMDGTTESRTDMGVAVSTSAFQRLRVSVQNGTTAQVVCSVDSTYISKTTNVPGSTNAMDIYLKTETSDTTSENNDINYVRAWQDDPVGDLAQTQPAISQTTPVNTSIDLASRADIAENYQSVNDQSIEPGTVVSIDNSGKVASSSASYDPKLVGIISTNPTQTLGADNLPGLSKVALTGRVPTKVSTENGPIKVGDYLTSSSTPGVAMKATHPGQMVGKALEAFPANTSEVGSDSSEVKSGKILVFVNVTYADPSNVLANLNLDDKGNLIVAKVSTTSLDLGAINQYIDTNVLGASTTSLSSTIQQLQADNVYVKQTAVDVASKLQTIDDKLASLDSNVASQSAQLAGVVSSVQSQESRLEELQKNLSFWLDQNPKTTTDSGVVAKAPPQNDSLGLTPPDILLASGSATLANVKVTDTLSSEKLLTAIDATISGVFKALGNSFLGNTTIAGDLVVDGTFSVTQGSHLNALPTIYIQDNPLAEKVDIFNGKVTIDKTGTLKVDTLIADQIKVTTGQSAGKATIKAGQTDLIIENNLVKQDSVILITPNSSISQAVAVADKVNGGFLVKLSRPELIDITFDYLIIGQEQKLSQN